MMRKDKVKKVLKTVLMELFAVACICATWAVIYITAYYSYPH